MDLTGKEIKDIWEAGASRRGRFARIRKYYEGKQSIAELELPRIDGRAKSQVKTNWVRYVTRMHTGFLTSTPIKYTVPGQSNSADPVPSGPIADLKRLYLANRLNALDVRHMKNAILYGRDVEVHTYDSEENISRIVKTVPEGWEFVRDDDDEIAIGIYRNELKKGTLYRGEVLKADKILFYVYDSENVTIWEQAKEGSNEGLSQVGKPIEHIFGRPPIVVFSAQEDEEPFFSDAFLTQCDVYDITRSSLTDDIKHNVDALLAIKGVKFEQLLQQGDDGRSVLQKLKEIGILPLEKESEANYISRNVDIEKFRYDLKVTRASIHIMGCVPDLDETIGGNEGTITNISGIALKLMFHSMIQQSAEFETHFEAGLRDRIDLINIARRALSKPEIADFQTKFTRNIPMNDVELMQYLPGLREILSRHDLLTMMPFIPDVSRSLSEPPAAGGAGSAGNNSNEGAANADTVTDE